MKPIFYKIISLSALLILAHTLGFSQNIRICYSNFRILNPEPIEIPCGRESVEIYCAVNYAVYDANNSITNINCTLGINPNEVDYTIFAQLWDDDGQFLHGFGERYLSQRHNLFDLVESLDPGDEGTLNFTFHVLCFKPNCLIENDEAEAELHFKLNGADTFFSHFNVKKARCIDCDCQSDLNVSMTDFSASPNSLASTEITLNKDFKEITSFAVKLNFPDSLLSVNAVHFTDTMVSIYSSFEPIEDGVIISGNFPRHIKLEEGTLANIDFNVASLEDPILLEIEFDTISAFQDSEGELLPPVCYSNAQTALAPIDTEPPDPLILSPCLDFVEIPLSSRLSYWYHLFGADIGTLEILPVPSEGIELKVNGEYYRTYQLDEDGLFLDLTPFPDDTITLTPIDLNGNRGESLILDRSNRACNYLTVNDPGDEHDQTPGDGVCLTASNTCTLRAAMEEVNAQNHKDTILFELPPSSIIQPSSPFPDLLGYVVLDATSQPGYNEQPLVKLNGANAPNGTHGLTLLGTNNEVKGLDIYGFSGNGILIGENAADNRIADCNIHHNALNGIAIDSLAGSGNEALFNFSIAFNEGLGLDIGNSGVNPNDPNDADTGPNQLQNFPELVNATTDGSFITITGKLQSTPNQNFYLALFGNETCDPSGFGEGETLLDTINVETNINGEAPFELTYPDLSEGIKYVTAIASDLEGNTSEFSNCISIADDVEIGCYEDIYEIRQLLADGDSVGGNMGISVAIEGDFAFVGAYKDALLGIESGAAYIYYRHEGGENQWGKRKKLFSPDPGIWQRFGFRVVMEGDLAAISEYKDNTHGNESGTVFLYGRNQGGYNNWGLIKKITADDGTNGDWFGYAIDIHENMLLIGANLDDDHGHNSGAAYLFEQHKGGENNWGFVKKFTPDDGEEKDFFGWSVAIYGADLAISAVGDDNQGSLSGAVYTYNRNHEGTDNWGLVQKLTVDDGAENDEFGRSIALFENILASGAIRHDAQARNAGAVYLFEKESDDWSLIRKLMADDGGEGDHFGQVVQLNDQHLFVGAPRHSRVAEEAGAAYIYCRNQGGENQWEQIQKLQASNGFAGDEFGRSVDISETMMIIGAHLDSGIVENQGSAYIFGIETDTRTDSNTIHFSLNQGLNIISSYIKPDMPNMFDVTNAIEEDLLIIKDGDGKVFAPEYDINQIGDWDITKGYILQTKENTHLKIKGSKVDPLSTPIPIIQGWQIIPYLKDHSDSIKRALAPIKDHIIIVENNEGDRYMPQLNTNDIHTIDPGMGYLMKADTNTTLTYLPRLDGNIGYEFTYESPAIYQDTNLQYFIPNIPNTGNNATMIIPVNTVKNMLEAGDELGIFSAEGLLCGAAIYEDENLAITIWGDDLITGTEQESLGKGDPFFLKIWKSVTNEVVQTNIQLEEINPTYESNGVYILSELAFLTNVESSIKGMLFRFFPNPTNEELQIQLTLKKYQHIRLDLYDLEGRKIANMIEEFIPQGEHEFAFSIANLSGGIYLLRLQDEKETSIHKLVVEE